MGVAEKEEGRGEEEEEDGGEEEGEDGGEEEGEDGGEEGKEGRRGDLKRKKYFITSTKTVFNHIYYIHHLSYLIMHSLVYYIIINH